MEFFFLCFFAFNSIQVWRAKKRRIYRKSRGCKAIIERVEGFLSRMLAYALSSFQYKLQWQGGGCDKEMS